MSEHPDYDAAVEWAKRRVARDWPDGSVRQWLEATPPDGYASDSYRCQLFVLEGSPPKGYVLRTPYFVAALSAEGRRLHTWHSWEVKP